VLAEPASRCKPPVSARGQKFFAYNNTTRTDCTGVYMAPVGTQSGTEPSGAETNGGIRHVGVRC
jgi:hypothetical protein